MNKLKHVSLGGTFDLLHKGHKSLLEKALGASQFLTIGLSTDDFGKKLGKTPHETFAQRKKNLTNYLTSKKAKKFKIIPLNDIYGNTLKDKSVEAIVVSKETLKGADQINKERNKKGLKKLKVIISPQVNSEDKKIISSTRIREGEITPDGKLYKTLLYSMSNKQFSQQVRSALKKPLSKVAKLDSKLKAKNIIAVGDISVATLLKLHILPKISVVDLFVQRKPAFSDLSQLGFGGANPDVIVKNEPGQISKSLIDELEKAMKKTSPTVILVSGEEDLAAIPAVLLAPLGTIVIYGQPNKGAVIVHVDQQIKDRLLTNLR